MHSTTSAFSQSLKEEWDSAVTKKQAGATFEGLRAYMEQ